MAQCDWFPRRARRPVKNALSCGLVLDHEYARLRPSGGRGKAKGLGESDANDARSGLAGGQRQRFTCLDQGMDFRGGDAGLINRISHRGLLLTQGVAGGQASLGGCNLLCWPLCKSITAPPVRYAPAE
jgi:hypothetical protein